MLHRCVITLVLALGSVGSCLAQAPATLEQARKALDADLVARRQKGEPATLQDLPKPQPLADSDNAATDLRAAAKAVNYESDDYKAYDSMEIARPLTSEQAQILLQAAADQDTAMKFVAAAMGKKADWHLEVTSPAIGVLLPDLAQQRLLARTIRLCALASHADADDAAALQHVREILFVARAVDEQPFLISHLVAIGIDSMAADVVSRIAVDLQPVSGDAIRERCKQIIGELLGESRPNQAFVRTLQFERIVQVDTAICVADGRLAVDDARRLVGSVPAAASLRGEAFQRAVLVDVRLLTEQMDKTIAAVDANLPATRAKLPPALAPSPDHPFLKMMQPSLTRPFQVHFKSLAVRRLAAVVLATRCYIQDHNGQLPPDLQALTPAYLPAVPMDPLAAGDALKYDAKRGIVYSVGIDGANSAGTDAALTQRLR